MVYYWHEWAKATTTTTHYLYKPHAPYDVVVLTIRIHTTTRISKYIKSTLGNTTNSYH